MQTLTHEPATPDPNLLAVQLYPVGTVLGILGAFELPALLGGSPCPVWLASVAGCLGLGVALVGYRLVAPYNRLLVASLGTLTWSSSLTCFAYQVIYPWLHHTIGPTLGGLLAAAPDGRYFLCSPVDACIFPAMQYLPPDQLIAGFLAGLAASPVMIGLWWLLGFQAQARQLVAQVERV